MVFEHFALNVNNVDLVSMWYAEHLKLKIVSQQRVSPFMTFLADAIDRGILVICQLKMFLKML